MRAKDLNDVLREVWHPSNLIAPTCEVVEYWSARGIAAPRYRYPTAAYVDALGLAVRPLREWSQPKPSGWRDALSRPTGLGFSHAKGVRIDDWLYVREFDGTYRAVAPVEGGVA